MRRIFLIFLLSCISLLFGASGRTPAIVGAAEPAVILPTGVDERQFAMDMVWQAVRKLPIGERPRVTLVLGGGGARGLSHVGVLRVFEEEQIPVDQIIGVSV